MIAMQKNSVAGKRKRHSLFWATYALVVIGVAVLGMALGLVFGYAIDLPRVDELQKVRPNVVSYVYADDGRVLGQFATEKRILVTFDQIPKHLKEAILAAEDGQFFRHSGIDFSRAFMTLFRDTFLGERKGFSTLTMQLSKLQFTSRDRTLKRKITDMLYAIEIEKTYSKEQIFTIYFNQIYMGHGTYGFAAAADFYLHKQLKDLTVAEAALLAGIVQSPERHSPISHPDQSLRRRNNYVLPRMLDEGFIDAATYQKAIKEPLVVHGRNFESGPAPYFIEWVRISLEQKHTADEIWKSGLRIYTTVDYDMQVAANRAIRDGLKKFDRERRRWRGPIETGLDPRTYQHADWLQIFYEGLMVPGIVLQSSASQAQIKIGGYTALLGVDDVAWTGRKRVSEALKPGDVAMFSIEQVNRSERTLQVALDRIPEAQAALMAIENKTGAIKAMVGGFDFRYSKFNRATQALRQPGSIFKPFTYVTAMESGYSPFDTVLDAPISFRDGLGRLYQPTNEDEEYKGLISIQQALYQSRNVPTIRLANALGIKRIIDVAHRFGIRREFPPYLPVSLGAGELTLQEITSAFTTFPNNGVRAEPYFIKRVEDYNGVTLEEHRHRVEEVVSPETAGKMVFMLKSVTERGTASTAVHLAGDSFRRPMGGKTGTTNDFTDSWFVGFIPQLTAGVWAGRDEKKPLGNRVFGATLALPIWIEFMKEVFKELPAQDFETSFQPSGPSENNTEALIAPQPVSTDPITVEDIKPPL
ncbi:MAG: PBP1A family penicillin-binding protein [Acidobacteria bacterium]|nr:MAG: PBP1A family penicillin-binding protein [Acidobacteriota bacterium]